MKAKEKLSKGAASGMVSLVFLVLGFQLAIFVVKVVERPPETAPVTSVDTAAEAPVVVLPEEHMVVKTKYGGYPRPGDARSGPGMTAKSKPGMTKGSVRSYASFAFDPNTVSQEDLQRLGLSERQAASIENYRAKGGRFRSKTDFRKMYVVSDSLFARLEPFIEIPKLELNAADSAALVSLRGIGPWYARKILDYRERLGGFVAKEQLLEIDGIDAERFAGFSEDIVVDAGRVRQLDLWHASDSVLARHPYLCAKGARSIVRYRALYDSTRWTPGDLAREHVLSEENIEKLKKYIEIQ